jgi:hypothetical protein
MLAKWTLRYLDEHPNQCTIYHFVGATPNGSNTVNVIQRIMKEIQTYFALDKKVETSDEAKLKENFVEFLSSASHRGFVGMTLCSFLG